MVSHHAGWCIWPRTALQTSISSDDRKTALDNLINHQIAINMITQIMKQ